MQELPIRAKIPEQRKWVNPFALRVEDYPNQILLFREFQSDLAVVRGHVAKTRRVTVEFGSGSGGHLIELASRYPESINFGFELRFKRAVRTVEKAERRGVRNLVVLNADARRFAEIFAPNSVDLLVVNFPDPWAKKRQLKHRLLGQSFFDAAYAISKPDGELIFKTDHLEYFDATLKLLADSRQWGVIEQTMDLYHSRYVESNIQTEFERLFVAQQLPIAFARLVRR